MSVRTHVVMNEKVEYKVVDEQGRSRSIGPSASNTSNYTDNLLIEKNS
jgi:hypothetical protein